MKNEHGELETHHGLKSEPRCKHGTGLVRAWCLSCLHHGFHHYNHIFEGDVNMASGGLLRHKFRQTSNQIAKAA